MANTNKQCCQCYNNRVEVRTLMIFYFIVASLVWSGLECEPNCASCRNLSATDYYCLACSQGNELVKGYSICIQNSTIPNCAIYEQTLNCYMCQPSFQYFANSCSKMYDGCLLQKNGACYLCQPGSFIYNDTGQCDVNYLNCMTISAKGSCTECYPSYSLQNGKCASKDSNCQTINPDTGLCSDCAQGWVQLGYICVSAAEKNAQVNCYMATRGSNLTCSYCKVGYGAYFGKCVPFRDIINQMGVNNSNCSNPQFLADNQALCLAYDGTNITNCLVADFGLQTCTICLPSFSLSNNSCVSTVNKFCLTFDSKGASCSVCKATFYLQNGVCLPFPQFCTAYNGSCTQCQPQFQLTNGRCMDPNCQTVNLVTGICQICFINFQLSAGGLCRYVDVNCMLTGKLGNCLQCQKGYSLKPTTGLCTYQDVNCLSFDNVSGICQLCKPYYYYNSQGQICIPLPTNCIVADISGRCTQCQNQFTLTSGYQCLFIPTLPNCKMVNQNNYTFCALCVDGYFTDIQGNCQKLPAFCLQYDTGSSSCVQCNANGIMKGGMCVDKNCLIFDTMGYCLGCLQSYIFGNLGQCIPQVKDPNCNQYQFGICKSCSERYYFNYQFDCVPVSPFCNTYDSNSGACTSCYTGYQLSLSGDCNLAMFNAKVFKSDILLNSCKTMNTQGQCIECQANFNSVPMVLSNLGMTDGSAALAPPPVNCVQRISGNGYCLEYDAKGVCKSCVSRMYLDASGTCKSVDSNCDQYNKTTGACITCYPGFAIALNPVSATIICTIINSKDPNCQIKGNSSSCAKCYPGYYYSIQSLICLPVNQQCATYNDSNGDCLSCYSGYKLQDNNCVMATQPQPTGVVTPAVNNSGSNTKDTGMLAVSKGGVGCVSVDLKSGLCLGCEWGYVLLDGTCKQRDVNCQTFAGNNSLNCLQCYPGYQTLSSNLTQCVSSNLIIPQCIKYDVNITCMQCDKGFVLATSPAGSLTSYTCNIIDQNCMVYNASLNACQRCNEGTVLQGRTCIFPVYGIDANCVLYVNGLCKQCGKGWALSGFMCSQQ